MGHLLIGGGGGSGLFLGLGQSDIPYQDSVISLYFYYIL
jgi:hypothetical protein